MTDPVIEQFLKTYPQRQDFYRGAAAICHEQCRGVLEQNGIRQLVTFRSKRPERLREKLYQRRERGLAYLTEDDILDDIVDLAGVRVALYFPGDLADAVKLLEDQFDVRQKKVFEPFGERRGSIVYAYRFPGYSATHLQIRLRNSSLEPEKRHYTTAPIEIQIASLFMHAWAEVEHDLVYKPLQGQLSTAEYALLDQANGLAFAGEVALEQLQRAMRSRLSEGNLPFQNHYDLASYLHSSLTANAPAGWEEPEIGRADKLLLFLQSTGLDRPIKVDAFLGDLAASLSGRTVTDLIVERIIAEEPPRSADRTRAWREIGAAMPEVGRAAQLERRLRKLWRSFENTANRARARLAGSTSRDTAQTSLDRDELQKVLGFDAGSAGAVVTAQQAYLRILGDAWKGTDAELERHVTALEKAIRFVYAQFPGLLAGRTDEL